jgi:hypothetical protein
MKDWKRRLTRIKMNYKSTVLKSDISLVDTLLQAQRKEN